MRKTDGEDDHPTPWTQHDAIKTGTETNTLKVIVQGDTITLLANNIALQTVTSPSLGVVKIGIGAGDNARVHIHLDNLKVWAIKS